MIAVSFSAWKGDRYVGLVEVLVVLGAPVLDLWWDLEISEVAPEPRAEALEALSNGGRVTTLRLIGQAAPDLQIIDGSLTGYPDQASSDPLMRITAVDSSWWDVETSLDQVLPALRQRYPDLIPLPP